MPGELSSVGLRAGEVVRWRRSEAKRWSTGRVARLEADGSLGVVDARGAARSIAASLAQVRRAGPRGAVQWEPVEAVAARTEQLDLF